VYNAIRSSHFIALFIPVTPSNYFQNFLHTANQLAENADYSLLVLPLTNNTVSTTAQIKFCKQNKVHGIIICQDPLQAPNPKFKKIKELGIPVIVIGGSLPSTGVHYFKEDIEPVATLVAQKIVAKNKRHVLAIFDATPSNRTELILNAFIDTVSAHENNISVEYASSTSEVSSLCKLAVTQKKYDAIFCMNDALLLGAWQALQATHSPIDLFGMSETGIPSLLPPTISYAYYSGEAAAIETMELVLKIMREKIPATENIRSISWKEGKA
jgi:DNA-binding LacI/PurR family transcriptional regulator